MGLAFLGKAPAGEEASVGGAFAVAFAFPRRPRRPKLISKQVERFPDHSAKQSGVQSGISRPLAGILIPEDASVCGMGEALGTGRGVGMDTGAGMARWLSTVRGLWA